MMASQLPTLYDTKVMICEAGKQGKTDLESLFMRCLTDKKMNNSLQFAFCKTEPEYSVYET